ncbi:MAG TPA: tRNA pseudouridine(55) synthase TruB [Vicinamibacteria bacterium]|nr:tRNA pseudouridine(55) synthase TruB [Vicinamibacteria bacterium]
MDGVLVVDKPAGPTSHDVVDHVRRSLGTRRVGHTGTLDPFATGVLAVCVGKATRLARFLAAGEKTYRATVRLGFATTTDDLTGEPLSGPRAVDVTEDALDAATRELVGERLQVPPAYSAKRAGGQRFYELARRGIAIERAGVPVVVYAIDVRGRDGDRFDLEVRCGAGTYVRALARDLGEILGTGGHLVALRRVRSGAFAESVALAWGDVPTRGREALIPMHALLLELPAVTVTADGREALRHGRDLAGPALVGGFPSAPGERVRVLDDSGALVALAVPRAAGVSSELPVDALLHPEIVLLETAGGG